VFFVAEARKWWYASEAGVVWRVGLCGLCGRAGKGAIMCRARREEHASRAVSPIWEYVWSLSGEERTGVTRALQYRALCHARPLCEYDCEASANNSVPDPDRAKGLFTVGKTPGGPPDFRMILERTAKVDSVPKNRVV